MNDSLTAHRPIVIDRVERSRSGGDSVRLRLSGHRLTAATEPELDPLLVVPAHGRRHRFAASGTGYDDPAAGTWEANFTVPDWAVAVESGQASLWVGDAAVPVPPVGTRIRGVEPAPAVTEPAPAVTEPAAAVPAPKPAVTEPAPAVAAADGAAAHVAPLAEAETVAGAAAAPAGAEAGRSGPLADALIRETVSALHAELEQRSTREAALAGALERARAELQARTASRAELEATQGELRTELSRLGQAVADQRAEFQRRLTADRERLEATLAQERSRLADGGRELDGARAELAHARAEVQRGQAQLEQAQAQLERADAQLAGAREQEAGLTRTREQLAAVSERLAAALQSDRLRAQEAASLRERLAAAQISRDAAIAEAGGLRAELARLGSELAVTRERSSVAAGDLGAAQQLLEDARALTAQLRGQGPG